MGCGEDSDFIVRREAALTFALETRLPVSFLRYRAHFLIVSIHSILVFQWHRLWHGSVGALHILSGFRSGLLPSGDAKVL